MQSESPEYVKWDLSREVQTALQALVFDRLRV